MTKNKIVAMVHDNGSQASIGGCDTITAKTANDLKIEELEGIMACFIKAMKQDFYLPEIKDKALQEVWRVLNE